MSNCHVAKTAEREREHTFQQSWLSTPDRSTQNGFQAANWREGEVRLGTSFVKTKNKAAVLVMIVLKHTLCIIITLALIPIVTGDESSLPELSPAQFVIFVFQIS
jgi:hypothetical protein